MGNPFILLLINIVPSNLSRDILYISFGSVLVCSNRIQETINWEYWIKQKYVLLLQHISEIGFYEKYLY